MLTFCKKSEFKSHFDGHITMLYTSWFATSINKQAQAINDEAGAAHLERRES